MDIHQEKLIARARGMGINVRNLLGDLAMDMIELQFAGRREIVWKGRVFSDLSLMVSSICDNKHATKAILREMAVPTPDSVLFEDPRHAKAALVQLMGRTGTCVAKPNVGTEGEAVRIGLSSFEEVLAYWGGHKDSYPAFLLEAQVAGHDLRIQAIGGRVAAACIRECAAVVGDGVRTVSDLVEARHSIVHAHNPANRLEIDDTTLTLLGRVGLRPDSVPKKGLKVTLKDAANMSLGATAIDVSDELHPGYGEWIGLIADRLGVRFFALDLMTKDHTADPPECAVVLEVNPRPQWLHHTFSERRRHDIPRMILSELFQIDPVATQTP